MAWSGGPHKLPDFCGYSEQMEEPDLSPGPLTASPQAQLNDLLSPAVQLNMLFVPCVDCKFCLFLKEKCRTAPRIMFEAVLGFFFRVLSC